MTRWSTGILVVVALFIGIVATVLALRQHGAREDRAEAQSSAADYRIKEVRLREETQHGTRWQLDAEQAEVFEQAGRTTLRKVVITIEDKTRKWTVTGDEGDMVQATKDLDLRGHVVVVASDGLRLETNRLRWEASSERAWTDAPVTLYRSSAVITGRGLSAKINEEAMTVTGGVRAVINQGHEAQREEAAAPSEQGAGTVVRSP